MTPTRRASDLAVFGWIHNPVVQVALDGLLFVLLFVAIFQQVQLQHNADSLKAEVRARSQGAYENCQNANDSRSALVGVLEAGLGAIRRSDRPPAEKAASIQFYEDQIAKVKLSDCTVYLPAKGDE